MLLKSSAPVRRDGRGTGSGTLTADFNTAENRDITKCNSPWQLLCSHNYASSSLDGHGKSFMYSLTIAIHLTLPRFPLASPHGRPHPVQWARRWGILQECTAVDFTSLRMSVGVGRGVGVELEPGLLVWSCHHIRAESCR